MLLGGELLGERFIWWNFVSSRHESIEQAKADWENGKIEKSSSLPTMTKNSFQFPKANPDPQAAHHRMRCRSG
jgi:hypothetical protein